MLSCRRPSFTAIQAEDLPFVPRQRHRKLHFQALRCCRTSGSTWWLLHLVWTSRPARSLLLGRRRRQRCKAIDENESHCTHQSHQGTCTRVSASTISRSSRYSGCGETQRTRCCLHIATTFPWTGRVRRDRHFASTP